MIVSYAPYICVQYGLYSVITLVSVGEIENEEWQSHTKYNGELLLIMFYLNLRFSNVK